MMETKLEREVRFLKAYAVVATLLCAVFVLTAFTMQSRKQKFEEIDVERINEAAKLKDGPEKDSFRQQAVAHQRVFIGRTSDKQARIVLSDANGRPRIRLSVEQNGEAKLEFLDRSGKVTQTLPTPSGTPNK
jgi:hypothetical protein